MKISLVCFTASGETVCGKIMEVLEAGGHECLGYKKGNFTGKLCLANLSGSLGEWTKCAFLQQDALIFIGATGIAVRAVAPFVKSKATDPACIVIDEQGNYVIPLLSGHIGGANQLAREIGTAIGALPVITTATDLHGLFAVDEWARSNRLYITDMIRAKQIAASLLEGKKCGVFSSFPIQGKRPPELTDEDAEMSVEVSIASRARNEQALQLVPCCLVLGIGCRKNTPTSAISALVEETLNAAGISEKAVFGVASIDLKAEETGLLEFCKDRNFSFQVFSSEELAAVEGNFSVSQFVSSITGVDNVCERAAVLASGNGRLIVKKKARDGVTVAAALREPELKWPEVKK